MPPCLARIAISATLIGTIGSFSGCKTTEVPAAADVASLPLLLQNPREDAPYIEPVLDDESAAEVRAAFALATEGASVGQPPTRAPNGRWSDMLLAVELACDDVEAAIVVRTELPAGPADGPGYRFILTTITDQPGELIVRRTLGDEIYTATARIGRYDDRAAAQALIDALDRNLRTLGQKRGFEDGSHDDLDSMLHGGRGGG